MILKLMSFEKIKKGKQNEDIWENGGQENILTWEVKNNTMEKNA
jgi:hypothetical protein